MRTQPLSIPQGQNTAASYRLRATKSVGRQIWEPNQGAPTARRAAPTPRIPPSDHPTPEHTTVGRDLSSTTATLATQCTQRTHIASHASHNSAKTRPSSPNSITTIAHTRTSLTRRPQRPQLNLIRLHSALTICTSPHIPRHRAGPGATGAGQATGAPRPQPRRRYTKNPGHGHPTMHPTYHP